MRKVIITVVVMLLSGIGAAQQIKIPLDLQRLAAKASETVDITMDKHMLQLAMRFLNDEEQDDAEARRIISKLNGLYVRSYEFKEAGAYSIADVEALRVQLQPPLWSRIVGVRSQRDGENVDVYFKDDNGKLGGIVIISAEPRELTIVHLDGPIDPAEISALGGQFGIPKVRVPEKPAGARP